MNVQFRFLHAADIHPDSPLRCLSRYEADVERRVWREVEADRFRAVYDWARKKIDRAPPPSRQG